MRLRSLLVFLLLSTPAAFSSAKDSNWVEVRTEHFTVVSDAGEKQARKTAAGMEQMERWSARILSRSGASLHGGPSQAQRNTEKQERQHQECSTSAGFP
jgi:hypothetical protein